MELHNRSEHNNLAPKEGQRDLLCSNKKFVRCPSFGTRETLTEKDIEEYSILLEDIAKIFIDKHLKEYYDE